MRAFTGLVVALLLAACGPSYAPASAPGRPCPEITAEEFATAIEVGAAQARVRTNASGVSYIETGPGVVHCATYNSAIRPCRRPNDFVLHYSLADGTETYVRVPAGLQYRYRPQATPTSCEIVNE